MSPESEESPTAEVLVSVKTAAVLSPHSVHKVGGQDKGSPLTLEPLDIGREGGRGGEVTFIM